MFMDEGGIKLKNGGVIFFLLIQNLINYDSYKIISKIFK